MKVDAIRLIIKDGYAQVLVKTKGIWSTLLQMDISHGDDSVTILSKEAKRFVDKALSKYYFNKYHDGD